MSIDSTSAINYTDGSTTKNGTKIVKHPGQIDKNAFLQILTAEMKYQDPTKPQDTSQMVSQLAQFTSLEQMTNLNNTMTFSSGNALIGETVTLKDTDSDGKPYSGIVQSATKDGDTVYLNVSITKNGKQTVQKFDIADVTDINADASSSVFGGLEQVILYLNDSLQFSSASSLIGKNVTLSDVDSNNKHYSGVVQSVSKNGTTVTLNVNVVNDDGSKTLKQFNYDDVTDVTTAS